MEAERIAEKQKSLQRSSLLKRRWEKAGLLYWPQEWWENRWRVDNRREWRQVSASHKCQGHHSGFDRPLAQHSTSALLSFAAVSKSAYLYQWEQRGWLCLSLLTSWWVFKKFREVSALNNMELIKNMKWRVSFKETRKLKGFLRKKIIEGYLQACPSKCDSLVMKGANLSKTQKLMRPEQWWPSNWINRGCETDITGTPYGRTCYSFSVCLFFV